MGVWHTYSTRQTLSELETDKSRGLSGAEAERRLARWGANGPRVVAETFSVATQSARMLALYEGRNDPRWN